MENTKNNATDRLRSLWKMDERDRSRRIIQTETTKADLAAEIAHILGMPDQGLCRGGTVPESLVEAAISVLGLPVDAGGTIAERAAQVALLADVDWDDDCDCLVSSDRHTSLTAKGLERFRTAVLLIHRQLVTT